MSIMTWLHPPRSRESISKAASAPSLHLPGKAKDNEPAPALKSVNIVWGDPHTAYRFHRVLGQGHYGTTFLCTALESQEQVAIKALDKHHPEFDRGLAVEELRILATISDHPNVASLIEAWEDGNFIYIVLEVCLGGELFDQILERQHLTEHETARLLHAIMSVLHHCHSRCIIHRDLKPENFLLHRSADQVARPLAPENLRAIDFGLSKLLPRGQTCHSCVGSSYYVAPEVLKGEYSWQADVWSVGVIAYILLSGFPPFWGSSDHAIFTRILEMEVDFDYEPWHTISPAAKDFVARLLHKDPLQRMTLAQAMQHSWITEQAAVSDAPLNTAIFERLQKFTTQNRVKCMLMTLAARHLSDDKIGSLREIFTLVDADHDGVIDVHDLSTALELAGIDVEQEGLRSLLGGLDLAHEGKVHAEEFIAAALDQKKVLTRKAVNCIFAQLDSDKDGFLSLEELSRALKECHIDIGRDNLEGLMHREGALKGSKPGMISARSFQSLLLPDASNVQPVQLETYLQDVHSFSMANHLKQLAMLVIARHMEPEEVEGLRRLFQRLDVDATGTIDARQLREGLAHLGKKVGDDELEDLIEALDLKHHGVIEYDAFLAAALEEQQLVTEARLRAAFAYLDRDGDGAISPGELAQAMAEMGMDASEARQLLQETSGSRGEAVTLDDFRSLVLNKPPAILTKVASGEWQAADGRSIAAAIASADVDYWYNSPRSPRSPGFSPFRTSVGGGIPSPVISLARKPSVPPSPRISLSPQPSLPISPRPSLPLSPGLSRRQGSLAAPSPQPIGTVPVRAAAGSGDSSGFTSPRISLRPWASDSPPASPPAAELSAQPSTSPGSSGFVTATSTGSGGLSLFQLLQQYSSSGYTSPRRRSAEGSPFATSEPSSPLGMPAATAAPAPSAAAGVAEPHGKGAFGSHMDLASLGSGGYGSGEGATNTSASGPVGKGERAGNPAATAALSPLGNSSSQPTQPSAWLSSVRGDEPLHWAPGGGTSRPSVQSVASDTAWLSYD